MEQFSAILRKAFNHAMNGEEEEAMKLLDFCKNEEELGVLHRFKAEILEALFDKSKDKNHLREAIFYATKASNDLPNSVESLWYVASLMVKAGMDDNLGKKKIIEQCRKSLRIQNPDDPLGFAQGETPSTRIASVKYRIHRLLEDCLSNKELGIKSFWDSLTSKQKNEYFKVKISDFAHFLHDSNKATCIFKEALSFYTVHNKFEYWNCYTCSSKFVSRDLLREHYEMDHAPKLLPEQNVVLPTRVSEEWHSHILTGCWNARHMQNPQEDEPKSSDVSQREKLLRDIRLLLSTMLEHHVLGDIHIKYIIRYAMTALKKTNEDSSLIGLDKSHSCLCHLGTEDLMAIRQFLNRLREFSMDKLPGIHSMGLRDPNAHLQIEWRVGLEGEFLLLLNDEQLWQQNNCNFLDWFSPSTSIEDVVDSCSRLQLDTELTWEAAEQDTKHNFDTLQTLCQDVRNKLHDREDLNTVEEIYQHCENNGRAMWNAVWTCFEKTFSYEIFGDIIWGGAFDIEVRNTIDKGGVEIKDATRRLHYNNEVELMKSCTWLLHAAEERIVLMETISSLGVSDYQAFLAPALKCYIQEYLEKVRKANAHQETGSMKELSGFVLKYRHQKESSEKSADDGLVHKLVHVDELKVGQDHGRKRKKSDSI